jgi:hypothetical protein
MAERMRIFERGECFGCFEALQPLRFAEVDLVRALDQGIPHTGVAFHHRSRGI